MDDVYEYEDKDGDLLEVQPVNYDGVPHAAVSVLATNGVYATVHVPPDRAWEVCEAILDAAGVEDA